MPTTSRRWNSTDLSVTGVSTSSDTVVASSGGGVVLLLVVAAAAAPAVAVAVAVAVVLVFKRYDSMSKCITCIRCYHRSTLCVNRRMLYSESS